MRVRHGMYLPGQVWNEMDARARFVTRAQATAAARPSELIYSHLTAGILHGLPLVGSLPESLDILTVGASGGRSERGILAHRSPDADAPIRLEGDVWVTSVERTLVDIAGTEPLWRSLPMLDEALRRERTTTDRILEHVGGRSGIRATVRVARAVRAADGRSESAGESLSRARLIECGFTMPILQEKLPVREGPTPRVDFFWPDIDLIGEFDGFVKYGRAGGEVDATALWKEKRREDALRAVGHGMVRWVWDEAWNASAFTRLLVHAGVPRGGR